MTDPKPSNEGRPMSVNPVEDTDGLAAERTMLDEARDDVANGRVIDDESLDVFLENLLADDEDE